MGRNSKDHSLTRYEELLKISVQYSNYKQTSSNSLLLSKAERKYQKLANEYMRSVKRTLNKLNKSDKHLIKKEFFSSNRNPFWWTSEYSKSAYYRHRSSAVKSFLENFEPC